LSKEIAREGVVKVLDWYTRDSETRIDIYILISQADSAKEILTGQGATDEIKSFVLEDIMKNERSLSKAPIISILEFDNDLEGEGIAATAPAINLKKIEGKMIPQIMGTAIFKYDKLIGFLNGEETKDLMFIKNRVKGGILIEGTQGNDVNTPVSLEIFESKTKVTPVVDDEGIKINLSIDATVGIDEIEGTENFIDEEGRKKLEQSAEKKLKEQIEALIEKMQSEYSVDIFGFGAKLRADETEVWNQVSNNWEEIFKDIEVNVTTKVRIKNSAILSKPLKVSD
jgi:spore germination protein KC